VIETDPTIDINLSGDPSSMIECVKHYLKDKWMKDIHAYQKKGYDEMSQINLTLAEIGLEHDMKDLHKYEIRLTGRDKT
jgi:CopG family transcriptional regulator/antitoxin EndoAI